MAKRSVSNPLALAVLTFLASQPMYPYEIATALRNTGKEQVIKINWGSLYTVVQSLHKHGFISEAGTSRQGGRPERTAYTITESGRAEIRLWGEGWPADFDGSGDPVSHRLSLAARAFKAQALAAADLPGAPTQETEVFRRGELRRPRLAAASLTNA